MSAANVPSRRALTVVTRFICGKKTNIFNSTAESFGKVSVRRARSQSQFACVAGSVGVDIVCGKFIKFNRRQSTRDKRQRRQIDRIVKWCRIPERNVKVPLKKRTATSFDAGAKIDGY